MLRHSAFCPPSCEHVVSNIRYSLATVTGATIALIAAAKSSIDAQALVLIAPHVIVEDVSVRGIETSVRAYEADDLRTKLAVHHAHVDGMFWRWADVWRSARFRAWTIVPLLSDISCPVLIVQGEDDRYGTLQQVELIEEHVGGLVDSLVLPNCGHAPQIDHADTVLGSIVGFVRAL